MPIFKTYDQMLLESIMWSILSIEALYIIKEKHRMGLISDEEYIEDLEASHKSLVKSVTAMQGKEEKGEETDA